MFLDFSGKNNEYKKRNKLYYYLSDSIFLLKKVKKTYKFINDKCKSISYCVIKNYYGEIEYIDTNIDILLKTRSDYEKFVNILRINGFKRQKTNKLEYWHPYNEGYKEMWTGDDSFVSIHVHNEVAWRGIVYMDKKKIFSGLVKRNMLGYSFWSPSEKDDFIIHSAHIIFENFEIKLLDYSYLKSTVMRINFENISNDFGWEKDGLQYIMRLINKNYFVDDLPVTLPISFMLAIRFKKMWSDLLMFNFKVLFLDIVMYPIDIFSVLIYRKL